MQFGGVSFHVIYRPYKFGFIKFPLQIDCICSCDVDIDFSLVKLQLLYPCLKCFSSIYLTFPMRLNQTSFVDTVVNINNNRVATVCRIQFLLFSDRKTQNFVVTK